MLSLGWPFTEKRCPNSLSRRSQNTQLANCLDFRLKMSFENYGGNFPSNGQPDGNASQVAGPQDTGAPGQNNVSAGQPMQFPPADVASPTQSAQAGAPGEQKTTLWYSTFATFRRIGY